MMVTFICFNDFDLLFLYDVLFESIDGPDAYI